VSYLLDADAVIDHLSNEPWARAFVSTLAKEQMAVAATTLVEPVAAEAQLRAFLSQATVLPLTRRVIQRAAWLRADLLNRGLSTRSRAYDILAAAFALEHNLTLVTSNTGDYRGIRGLTQLDIRTGQIATH
jgi:tRNA(fMet)-specific endonuclease VapC